MHTNTNAVGLSVCLHAACTQILQALRSLFHNCAELRERMLRNEFVADIIAILFSPGATSAPTDTDADTDTATVVSPVRVAEAASCDEWVDVLAELRTEVPEELPTRTRRRSTHHISFADSSTDGGLPPEFHATSFEHGVDGLANVSAAAFLPSRPLLTPPTLVTLLVLALLD